MTQLTKLGVVIGTPRQGVVEGLHRAITRDGNGRVLGVGRHPVATADLVRHLKPDIVILAEPETAGTSIISFLTTFVPEDQFVIVHDGTAQSDAAPAAHHLTFEELETAATSDELPREIALAYVTALRNRRARDLKTIETLAALAEVREASSPTSVGRAADLATLCLEQVEPAFPSSPDVRAGFVLHDVGKIAIPETILQKDSALAPDEWALMEKHPELGVQLVSSLELGTDAIDVIRHHHERWDGSGYPGGLTREEIPVPARVFAAVDAYESMTSNRAYRAAMSQADALQIIKAHAGATYDPEVVDVLLKVMTEHDELGAPREIDLTG